MHHGKNTVHRQFLKILIPGEQLHQRQFPTSCSSRTDPAEPQRMAWSQARNVGLPNSHTGNGLKDQRLHFRSNHWSKIADDSSVNLPDANSSTISFFSEHQFLLRKMLTFKKLFYPETSMNVSIKMRTCFQLINIFYYFSLCLIFQSQDPITVFLSSRWSFQMSWQKKSPEFVSIFCKEWLATPVF